MSNLQNKISLLPQLPGVYQFFDSEGTVIYVGKAKSLRNRVGSYFNNSADHSVKVRALVRNIADLKHIVVDSEQDALLLENNLIKKHLPRYNILLKDSKSYPWICISNENFERIFSTRKLIKDGSAYFGPYANGTMQKTVLELIKGLFPLRSCKLNLAPELIKRGKYTVCLEFHIGNCKGCCEGKISEQEYRRHIEQSRDILKGDLSAATAFFQEQMTFHSARLEFEQAAAAKKKLELLVDYQHRSVIVSPTINNVDAVYLLKDGDIAFCNHIKVVHGAVISSYTFELKSSLDETREELLGYAISRIENLGREVVVPFEPSGITGLYTIPQRGEKVKLLELGEKNCRIYQLEKLKHIEKTDPERHTKRIMERMKADLHLAVEPRHIECFDNSNIQGSSPVAACVVFRDGVPSKRDYRHYNVKTVVGANDFATMEEILTRRYSRLVAEGETLPQLIVIDGGKGQLGAAVNALRALGVEIPVVGLAKRMEEVFFPGDPVPLYLDKRSETLKVLMHLRDEAHRFGITFHRKQRSAKFLKNNLEDIPGLGKASVEKLLKKYKTEKRIKSAPIEELTELIGGARAEKIKGSL
ncbi:Excinuclease ABC subunit C [Mucinivorans hirudinis]|uniref:UvrABC system protein C n=1 Tax=Mucinivorans hirudinis TaxID=1433126 RepID=A0A060R7W2_9BACT|nr:Excinuclease ABC subunit C [Mucinivorans hirudinis]